jgi:hypothetical protein
VVVGIAIALEEATSINIASVAITIVVIALAVAMAIDWVTELATDISIKEEALDITEEAFAKDIHSFEEGCRSITNTY